MEPGSKRLFGAMPNGDSVTEVALAAGDLAVRIITFGAVLRSIEFQGRPTVLGCDTLDDYIQYSPHFGAVVGRFANRIGNGHLELDGQTYQLTLNENGVNHLHGGAPGFSRRNWTLVDHSRTSATLQIVGEDGEQGYPGRLTATCHYSISGSGTLDLAFEATTDRTTIVNLAGHTYFNLDGAPTVAAHQVEILADWYLPADTANVPTGAIATVAGTPFDLRRNRTLGAHAKVDTAFILDRTPAAEPQLAARVVAPASGLALEVSTTEPSLQFYTGYKITPDTPGRDGRQYGPCAGLCLEGQRFPDAPNHQNFPSATLRPGEVSRQVTRYRFSQVA